MAYRSGKPTRLSIKRDIHALIRTFPSTNVRIKRLRDVYNDLGEQNSTATELVYEGEALVRPSGGTSETYGLGTVENFALVILIVGKHDIRQSDIVTVNDGREYEVQYPPGWFEAFMELRLTQRDQISRPTVTM